MIDFKAFQNESQVLTFPSGDDEMSVENGLDAIVISGTLTIVKDDPDSHANAMELRDALTQILSALPVNKKVLDDGGGGPT